MLSVALRLVVLALLAPVLYVVSALAWFPAVCWHAQVAPRASAVMGYRVAEASAAGQKLRLRHEWVPVKRTPQTLVQAVLVAEDTRFYEHRGFDFEQIRDAWRANRRGGRLRGASTISQQTAKNLYLDPSRNLLRKGREAILTAWLELWMPKERILELYLNVVELGPGVFGANAAARVYFDRQAGDMTREQTALLAATLPAPLARNPAASTPALRARQRMILSRMGRWYEGPSLAEEEAIKEQPYAPERRPSEPIGLEALEDSARADPAPPDTLPLDSGAVTGEDPAPAEDAPSTVPADSATDSS